MGLQTMHAVEGDGEQTGFARFTGFTPWKEELENKQPHWINLKEAVKGQKELGLRAASFVRI